MHILLVEDDTALAMGTVYGLAEEGMTVHVCDSFLAVREYFSNQVKNLPDCILLDIMLPDGDGYAVCEWIKKRHPLRPILFLTALSDEGNVVRGLNLGADDYICKPFRIKELVARIYTHVRKSQLIQERLSPAATSAKKHSVLTLGEISIDYQRFAAKIGEKELDLTPSEFRLLSELMQYKEQVLTREQIVSVLWDSNDSYVDDNTLSVYIRRLREKIALHSSHSYIQTVRGVGYRFTLQDVTPSKTLS